MDGTCEDISWSSISDSSTYVECAMKILYAGVGRRSQDILFLAPTHHVVNFLFDGWNVGGSCHRIGTALHRRQRRQQSIYVGRRSPDRMEDKYGTNVIYLTAVLANLPGA